MFYCFYICGFKFYFHKASLTVIVQKVAFVSFTQADVHLFKLGLISPITTVKLN